MKRRNLTELPLKIGDVAEMLGTSIRTIRYYEEEGLLEPYRSEGGTRLYSRRHIDRLRAILRFAKGGYPIEVVKALAQTRESSRTGDESQRSVTGQLDLLLGDIDARVHRLTALSKQIAAAKRTVERCAGCTNKPTTKGCPNCPVREHLGDIELLNLVWDLHE